MAIWRKVGGSGQHVGEALGELAAVSESQGRLSDAIALADQALAALAGSATDDRIKSIVLETRGRILPRRLAAPEARATLDEALGSTNRATTASSAACWPIRCCRWRW